MGVTVGGRELAGFDIGLPAASVRLLLPGATGNLVLPTWNGNEFLLDDGTRPMIRTLTPLRFDAERLELGLEIVLHGHGPLSMWADTAEIGAEVAVSGTGRGYDVDKSARRFLLAGDEAALPAIATLLSALPAEAIVDVFVEVRDIGAKIELPAHPGASINWLVARGDKPPGDALVVAVSSFDLAADALVWAAGEAAAMQRIRRYLQDGRQHPRTQSAIRGYWKVERSPGDL